MSWVLNEPTTTGGDRLVLISLANHAHPDGSCAYPSMATIAREANLTERAARYAMRRLEASGLIIEAADGPASVRADRRTRSWSIVMTDGGQPVAPRDESRGANDDSTGGNLRHRGGQPVAPEPKEEPTTEPNPARTSSSSLVASSSVAAASAAGASTEQPLDPETPARRKPPKPEAAAADEITRAWWDWIKGQTGHSPPHPFPAVRAIVAAALRDGFDRPTVKRGLADLYQHKRPVTKPTLWTEMTRAGGAGKVDPIAAMNRSALERRDAEEAQRGVGS